MKKPYLIRTALLLFIVCLQLNTQSQVVDSLERIITSSEGESQIDAILDLAIHYQNIDLSKASELLQDASVMAEQENYLKGKAKIDHVRGWMFDQQGMLIETDSCLKRALAQYRNINYARGVIGVLNTYSNLAAEQNDFDEALEKYTEALQLAEKNELDDLIIGLTINIGAVYYGKEDYAQALDHYVTANELNEKLGDRESMASIYGNIGIVHIKLGDVDNAISNIEKSCSIYKELELTESYALQLQNLAGIYGASGRIAEARQKFNEVLEIYEGIGHKSGLAGIKLRLATIEVNYGDSLKGAELAEQCIELFSELESPVMEAKAMMILGTSLTKQSQFEKADELYNDAFDTLIKFNAKSLLAQGYRNYSELLYRSKEFQRAVDVLHKSVQIKDSLYDLERDEAIIQMKEKFESDQKDKALEIQQISLEKAGLENRTKTFQRDISIIGAVLAVILLALMLLAFRAKKRSNKIISEQKNEVEIQKVELEIKNKDITDSLQYAKRIQSAILPQGDTLKALLPDYFVLYKPKDIVAGDFYWIESHKNKVLFAAADCTGHGVPGAMMSVLCNNGLNKAVRDHDLTDPGQILDRTRDFVIDELGKSEEEVMDGMDIALCSLEGDVLCYAGAHNPLWIIRRDRAELEETKANKQPIGKFGEQLPFTTHRLQVNKGDTIYLFSDGYSDQFGGEKGKKLKSVNFKKLLLSMQNESMQEQKQQLEQAFEAWKGELEQIDDVCVMGIRI